MQRYFQVYKKLKKEIKKPYFYVRERDKRHFHNYLSKYTSKRPNDQNSFSLFENSWSSKVPNVKNTGSFDGFSDVRIQWLIEQLDIKGRSVLELGPLEGAHTFMLENAGAEITPIEGNHGAFLRCLAVKNLLGLKSKFILGDFTDMRFMSERYDVVVACGVLYHMADPVALLYDLSKKTDNIFLWTHYFEEDLKKWCPSVQRELRKGKWDTKKILEKNIGGINVRTVRQSYGKSLGWSGFCGGPENFSYWIYKDDLLDLLKCLGFNNIRINFDKVDHPNGPCFGLLASRFDALQYIDPAINPDLHDAYGDLPADEQEAIAIEHYNTYGRKEGRKIFKDI